MIDQKTLFSALHGELNARVNARTLANTAHMQTISIFASASVIAMLGGGQSQLGASISGTLYYFLAAFIPFISLYFLVIYDQHDRQIGLLNRHLRRIEEASEDIPTDLRFFERGSQTGVASFGARFQAHLAVSTLGCSSLILLALGWLMGSLPDDPVWKNKAIWTCFAVTLINIIMMVRLEIFRRGLVRPDG